MTSPDQPDVPDEPTHVDPEPPTNAPTPPPTASGPTIIGPTVGPGSRRPGRGFSQRWALGLAGAFLLGACLCGAAGVAIGAVAGSHGFHHGSNEDRRDGRHDVRRPGQWKEPDSKQIPPTSPMKPAPTTSAPTGSVTPTSSPT